MINSNSLQNKIRLCMFKRTKFLILLCLLLSFSCSNESLTDTEQELIENPELNIQTRNSEITPATVSANGDDGNVPANTLDGSLNTRWSSRGYNGKYITYDLGSVKSVSSVKLAWFKGALEIQEVPGIV